MKLYLARHGRTNYNDLGFADPSVDVHLTSTGIAQATAFADKLRDVDIDHIFISELARTPQTAEIVNEFHHVNLETDPRLNDIRTDFEGRPFNEYMDILNAAPDKWTARPKDGESVEDMKARITDFISDLRTKDYNAVVIVMSQWVVRAFAAILLQLRNEKAWDLEVE